MPRTSLRRRAADLLGQTARLDGLKAMRVLPPDLQRISEAAGCDPDKLTVAALALYPGDGTPATRQE